MKSKILCFIPNVMVIFFIIFFPFIYTILGLSIETSMEQSLVAFGDSSFEASLMQHEIRIVEYA